MKKLGKIHKLALISLSSIALVASVALAQNAGTGQNNEKARPEWHGRKDGERRGRFMRGAIFEKLNLTDDQKARIKQLHESFREQTKSLREQLEAKHRELRQATEGGTFNEVLATPKLTE